MRLTTRLPEVEIAPDTFSVGVVSPERLPKTRELKVAVELEPMTTVAFALMATASPKLGTTAGDQFATLNQLLSAPPIQLMFAGTISVVVEIEGEYGELPEALLARTRR